MILRRMRQKDVLGVGESLSLLHSRVNQGVAFTILGWLLSLWSVLGAYGYFMGRISGGIETPDFVFISMFAILLTGGVLAGCGSYLLHRKLPLFLPAASAIAIVVILYFALPNAACSYSTCIPAGSHP